MQLIWTNPFLKKYQKWERKHPELAERAREKIRIFELNPFHRTLKTHSLVNELYGYWAFSISFEFRIIFTFTDDKSKAILLNIGSHDEVY